MGKIITFMLKIIRCMGRFTFWPFSLTIQLFLDMDLACDPTFIKYPNELNIHGTDLDKWPLYFCIHNQQPFWLSGKALVLPYKSYEFQSNRVHFFVVF